MGCLGGENTDVLDDPCNAGGAGGTSGSVGSGGSGLCDKPKQIRLLQVVTTLGTEIEVQYDSLDRREPRVIVDAKTLPTTELEPGDLVEFEPTEKVNRETVLVTDVGIYHDMNVNKYYRTFTATFTKPHILNAPGTTPIADGCPAFAMPVQEVCDEHGNVVDLYGACWEQVCTYGELVLMRKAEATPCGIVVGGKFSGACRHIGDYAVCDPAP